MMESATAPSGTATDDTLELNGQAPSGSSPAEGKKTKKSRRAALIVLAIVAVLAGGSFGAYYFIESSKYVSTDNAQVDGDKVQFVAPATGTLTNWSINQGSQVKRDQVVGRIKMQQGF